MRPAEMLAAAFHETHERLAPAYGERPSGKPWHDLPEPRRRLLVVTIETLLDAGYVQLGRNRLHRVQTGRPVKLT